MTALDLLDHLAARGIARPRPAPPGTDRALAVGPIEVARAVRASDTFMRARWRKRVQTGGMAYLLIADEPDETGRTRVLGPTSAKSPIHSVRGELLAEALQSSAGLPSLEAVRRIAADLARMTGDGLDVNGLLTRHTLEHRLRGDPSRWDEAAELTRSLRSTDVWRHVFHKLGYTVEQLPHRGLERMELRDPVFARVLVAVGQDQETKRGADFSTLEIAHIGHTYESLLRLRLSLAGKPLRYDPKADRYVAVDRDEAEVRSGGLL